MKKKCNFKYKGKCFKTKIAKEKYKSWEPIIKTFNNLVKKKSSLVSLNPKKERKSLERFRDSWIGK